MIQTFINSRARYYASTNVEYEVKSEEILNDYLLCNLNDHTCSCSRAWQLTGYPCGHALAVMLGRGENPQLYAKQSYTLGVYRNTYAGHIFHTKHSDDFTNPTEFEFTSYYQRR